jgi:hypothetical protein
MVTGKISYFAWNSVTNKFSVFAYSLIILAIIGLIFLVLSVGSIHDLASIRTIERYGTE